MTKPKFLPSKANLQSKHGLDVLDTIESLRSHGMSQYVDLPQIVVCGDQSSGKSSVLEALSGIAFPTKDALCTRFATELILRRCVDKQATTLAVSIIPGPNRSYGERKTLEEFCTEGGTLDLPSIIQSATELMEGLDDESVLFADILRVEVSGPSLPHLTLVDLPGLFQTGNKSQFSADANLVKSLVLSYMERPRSVILAVVSAKSECAFQQVTQRAREMDPEGDRTLGLITIPDALNKDSESEQAYIELAQNRNVHFRLGWHVLRNRDFHWRNTTNTECDAVERAVFSTGVWKSLDPDQLGIDALRQRLSRVLQDQVLKHLPLVVQEIKSRISNCKELLRKLGTARETTADQRRYLLKVSQEFTSLVKAAVDGDYSNLEFFGNPRTEHGFNMRLRAEVQKALLNFAQSMRSEGHAKTIVDEDDDEDDEDVNSEDTLPQRISRSRYIAEVRILIDRTRGCELPGTFNPLVVGELFSTQCQPWRNLAIATVYEICSRAQNTLVEGIKHVAGEKTAECIIREVITPKMSDLRDSVTRMTEGLLEAHTEGHPITYNHYLTENVQKAQNERHKRRLRAAMECELVNPNHGMTNGEKVIPMSSISKILASTEPDMESYASTIATDVMEAYYKVALKRFVDEVSVHAVESCLLKKLPSLLSLDVVCDLSEADVQRFAGESPSVIAERKRLTQKLGVLEDGLALLTQLGRGPTEALQN